MVNIYIRNFLPNLNCSDAPSGMLMDKIMENDIQHDSTAGIKKFWKVPFSLTWKENKKMINDDWQMLCKMVFLASCKFIT